jgi:hypothetical protein
VELSPAGALWEALSNTFRVVATKGLFLEFPWLLVENYCTTFDFYLFGFALLLSLSERKALRVKVIHCKQPLVYKSMHKGNMGRH